MYANKIENVEDWFVKKGWVLLTQSGNVGLPLYVTEALEKYVISQNFIRIEPKADVLSGYLYAYLSTWLGHSLITSDQFGVTVEHIRPHHISKIRVPKIPIEIQQQIHSNILRVYECRDKARLNLSNAEKKLVEALGLLPINDFSTKKKAFVIGTNTLNLRFDASYHSPSNSFINAQLKESGNNLVKLGSIANVSIPNRLKRIYVKKEYGLPFLQTSDLNQIRPRLLKYLSTKVTRDIEKWVIHKGWVLLPCSGTMGRRMGKACLTPSNWDGWAATQHIARIIPNHLDGEANKESINEGYLACFLSSPYGYEQIVSKTYGGVVDELSESDIRDIIIAKPSQNIQNEIGNLVIEAYELQETGIRIEYETVRALEKMLENVETNKTQACHHLQRSLQDESKQNQRRE